MSETSCKHEKRTEVERAGKDYVFCDDCPAWHDIVMPGEPWSWFDGVVMERPKKKSPAKAKPKATDAGGDLALIGRIRLVYLGNKPEERVVLRNLFDAICEHDLASVDAMEFAEVVAELTDEDRAFALDLFDVIDKNSKDK